MKHELNDIRDDQIRVIGESLPERKFPRWGVWTVSAILALVLLGLLVIAVRYFGDRRETIKMAALRAEEPAYFEPVVEQSRLVIEKQVAADTPIWFGQRVDESLPGFTEMKDTAINDIPLRLFIPHNASMSLHIGKVSKADSSIVYVAQAADVRADNGGIVGAFVLRGEPKAWGLSKKGFCASIDGKVTVGVAENSPLFEKATETGGYFFRQYPLVSNGQLVENEPKGKSVRRAVCERRGEIFMVESGTEESFHDFAQALVDLGVDQAIYLVGSSAFGWAIDQDGNRYQFGDENYYSRGRRKMPKNTSYIVWRKN